MFTGIVEEVGEIVDLALSDDRSAARVTVHGPVVTGDVSLGDSIAVDGICLTVVEHQAASFTAAMMRETLTRTAATGWAPGARVNLERSVTPTTRLGGHLVQGHVDGVGTVVSRTAHADYDDVAIAVAADLGRYLAPKGAVAVDGISLTVIDVTDGKGRTTFSVGIIPATRSATTMGSRAPGDAVNIEVDVMAKYAERLLTYRGVTG